MLDINPLLLLSSGVVFLLVLARLDSCLFKPLLKYMEDRENSIKKGLNEASGNEDAIESKLEEASHIIANAKKEASLIRQKAIEEAQKEADVKISQAKEELDKKYNEFLKSLETEVKELEDSLVANMPEFKSALKAKISNI